MYFLAIKGIYGDKKMKILVTGANGYIGSGVVKQLIKDNNNVVTTDICELDNIENVNYIKSDIFTVNNPYSFFGQPDTLLHLAWRDGFKHYASSHIDDLAKHYHFIEKMIQGGIKKVCVLGSVHEVGFYEGSVNEDTPTNPQSLYGISKNALRNAILLLAQENGIEFQWIRGYYIVGNTHFGSSIFSRITQAEEMKQMKFPFTMGMNQFDFINYEDFCVQIESVIKQDEISGIINCCSGYPQRIGERVEQFIKENNYSIKLDYGAFLDRKYDSKAIWGDNSKIERIMGKKNENSNCGSVV